MSIQISLKLSDQIFVPAKKYAELYGFDTLQDFIRELLREKLFEKEGETMGGFFTAKASEEALAKHWHTKEEEDAWAHLQEER